MTDSSGGFDAARYRQVLGHFATGVTIITAVADSVPAGFTAQSFTSLSLDPPLVAFFPARTSTSYPAIREAGGFCVNVLAADQQELCSTFAARGADRFSGTSWTPAPITGSPILDGTLAWIDCTLEAEHDGGDHFIVVGLVVDLGHVEEGIPLLFFRGGFGRFEA